MKAILKREELYKFDYDKTEYLKDDSVLSKTLEFVSDFLFEEILDASNKPKK